MDGLRAGRQDVGVRVAVAGEALVDLLSPPTANQAATTATTARTVTAVPGGGPFNAARAIARLGVPAAFIGSLSTDRFGQMLCEALSADGVDVTRAARVPEPTTLALAELDAAGSAAYRFYLAGTSASVLDQSTADLIRVDPPTALHVGTLGLVLQPCADVLAGLVADLPAHVIVFADPNCRPAAIGGGTAQRRYRSRLDGVLDRADFVKVSTEDLAYLVPDVEPLTAARRLRRPGGQVVLLTDGGRAAAAVHSGGVATVDVPAVAVIDTVGAGDTFGGAFLATWLGSGAGREALGQAPLILACLRRAVSAASLACTRAGAQPPTAAEVDAAVAAGEGPAVGARPSKRLHEC